jgi:hypothetical protein
MSQEQKRAYHKNAYTEQVMRVEGAKLDTDMARVKETTYVHLRDA